MPATVFHAFTNHAADGTVSSVVRPANWNSQHLVSLAPSGAEMIGGFSNANGVTFATNIAGRIEASIVTNYLPLGNSTQFAGAVHTHDYAASDHSHSQYLTTAAQSDHTHSQYLNTSQSSLLQHTSATSAITANAMNTSERGNYFYTSNNTLANQTHTHGAVAFSGTNASASFTSASNGLSIQLSAAAAGGAGDGYNILAAGGSTANTTGTVVFSNSNGVSFGLNGATMTASHNGLTTARASNDAIGLNTALTGNGVSVTANSSGLSINVPAFLTTAAQSGHSHGVTLNLTNINGTTGGNSNGINLSLSAVVPAQTVQPVAYSAANGSANFSTLAFANSQGVSFSTGTQGLYATVKTDYLTTARASTDAIGLNSAITQNGVSMTANSSGLSLNFPAFLTTAAQSGHSHGNPTLALTNLSGTTASASNGLTLSLSAANPGGGGGAALSAGTQSVSTGTVAFANSNGISFGMSGSNQITASHNGLTTARASNDGIGLNTAGTNVTWTVNSGGISLNAGGYAGTATTFNGTNISGSMTFNSAGLRLDLSGQGGGVINQTGPNIAAGTQTATSGTVVFSNSNNITFGMSNNSVVTASFNPINIGMSNIGNTAGTTGTFDGGNLQYVLAGGNNITLSQSANANSVTLSIHGAPSLSRSYLNNLGPLATASGAMGSRNVVDRQLMVFPLKPFQDLFNGNMTLNTMLLDLSVSGSTATLSAAGISTVLRFGLYRLATTGATLSLSLINSFAQTYGLAGGATNNSTYWQGQRWISVHSSEWSSQPVLTDNGHYFCGIHFSSVGSSAQTFALLGGFAGSTTGRSGMLGAAPANATHNGIFGPFLGVLGTTTGALPAGINYTQVNKQSASANFIPHIIAHNYTNLTML